MAHSIELTSIVGVEKHDLCYGPFRKWLTPIRVRGTVHPDLSREPEEIGEAFGFVVRREVIRKTFHKSMESPHEETMNLTFTLFDRYGRLKEEIREHSVRKGSGVWKEEVDNGNFILVENVSVNKHFRRRGIGTKLVLRLLQEAIASRNNLRFAFARPAIIHEYKTRSSKRRKTKRQQRELSRSGIATLTCFFRSLHFRRVGVTEWFGLAKDDEHPSRQLPSHEDPDPVLDDLSDSGSDSDDRGIVYQFSSNLDGTGLKFDEAKRAKSEPALHDSEKLAEDIGATKAEVELTSTELSRKGHPLHFAIKALDEKDALDFLKSHAQDGSSENFDIGAVDGHGDTILHVAARASKPACPRWIAEFASGVNLFSKRNHEGYTPLEVLEVKLEDRRTREAYGFARMRCVADEFDGYDDDSVACLFALMGVDEPTPEQPDRAKFGCSCGQCLRGILSPRMVENLHAEAELACHRFELVAPHECGESWYLVFKDMLIYLPDSLRSRFRRNKKLCAAFTELVGAVARCLADKRIPCSANVTQVLRETKIWPQIDGHYFLRGGTVAAVVNVLIDNAKDASMETTFCKTENDNLFNRPAKCRNDLEFEFVRRHCIDDAPANIEDGSKFPVDMPWLSQMLRMLLEGEGSSSQIQ